MNHYLMLTVPIAWLAVLFGGWLGWQLLRQNGRLLLRLEEVERRLNELEFGEVSEPSGLPVGSEAPDFDLPDLADKHHSLERYRGHPLVLIFFDPSCGFCRDFLPKLTAFPALASPQGISGTPPHSGLGIILISTGGKEANRQLINEHKLAWPVLLQEEAETAAAYHAYGTPSGYLIDVEGRIASQVAMGAEPLLALLAGRTNAENHASGADLENRQNRFSNGSLARSKIKRDGLKAGTLAPDFRLPRLDGHGELSLKEFRGKPVLLVFSSPGCGPCRALAPHLEQFHLVNPGLQLIMISKGELKENRVKAKEDGLTFPIVMQQQWEISRKYAIFATPVAYLINEIGIVSSDVAIGVDAILDLMTKAGTPSRGSWPKKIREVADLATTRV